MAVVIADNITMFGIIKVEDLYVAMIYFTKQSMTYVTLTCKLMYLTPTASI